MKNQKNFRLNALQSGVALLVMSLCGWAQAQSQDTDLGAVTVSAARGTQLQEMDVSTTVLTREQILNAPESTVEQLLGTIPGIFIPNQPSTQLHPTGQVLSIRGFGTSTNGLTLVLVDGVPLNDPYFRTVNWAQIPKDSIEKIEVIRGGGATSLWGNMALGGVINIITRQPEVGENHVQVGVGSFRTETLDVSKGVALSDDLKLGLSYGAANSSGYNQTPVQYQNPNMVATASQADNFNAVFNYQPNGSSRYFAKIQASNTKENGLIWNDAKNEWDTYRLTFGGQTKLNNKSSFNLNGWLMSGSMSTQNATNSAFSIGSPTSGTPYVSQLEKAQYQSTGGSAYWQTEWQRIKDIKVGVDLRSTSVNDPVNVYNASGVLLTNVTSQATNQFEGVFVQGTYRPESIPLDITLGLREDFWQANNATSSGLTFNNALPNVSSTHFDPRLGAKYYLDNGWDLRAATYRGFSAPGMNQMYRSFISGTSFTQPDTSLQPQNNQGYELGFDLKKPDYEISFTAFSNHVQNYIDFATVNSSTLGNACSSSNNYCGSGNSSLNNGTGKQYINAGNATMQGFELLGSWRVTNTLNMNAGFSKTAAYLTSSYNTSVEPLNQQLGQVPVWIATAGVNWKASESLTVSGQLKDFPNYWNNTSHAQVNQGACLVDVGANYKYDKSINLYGMIQNLTNQSYYDQGLTYSANGTVVTSSSGGTTPALGIPRSLMVGVRASF